MQYAFSLSGKASVDLAPAAAAPSAEFGFKAVIAEQLVLKNKLDTGVQLSADPAVPIGFGSLAGASLVLLRITTAGPGRVLATLTHADGTAQVLPVDPFLILISSSSPITAISLQRAAGVDTFVEVLLGELGS